MEFFDTVKNRHSIRAFRTQRVEDDKLTKIIETVNLAPSAGNLQAYEMVVVKDPRRKRDLAKAAWGQDFISQAPVSLVFLARPERSSRKYGRRGNELYCLQDATIAAAFALLATTALGLASTWVGAFDEEAVAKAVEAPGGRRPVVILAVGYSAEGPEITPRRPIGEIVSSETSETQYSFSFGDPSFRRPVSNP
jgi:nitroreductase